MAWIKGKAREHRLISQR